MLCKKNRFSCNLNVLIILLFYSAHSLLNFHFHIVATKSLWQLFVISNQVQDSKNFLSKLPKIFVTLSLKMSSLLGLNQFLKYVSKSVIMTA
jgi:hypothetical protein